MSNHTSSYNSLQSKAATYGISLSDDACSLLKEYESLIKKGNDKTNLVSKGDLERFVTHHILDSLKIASCIPIPSSGRLLDFGSGAGLPGIPFAIVFPELTVTLVDSRKKRCSFLDSAVTRLGLSNTSVYCTRIERLNDSYNNSFDLVTTRGTVSLESFFNITNRFIVPGGSLISIKGDTISDERTALDRTVDTALFNILYTQPSHIHGVRDGNIVIIQKR